MDDQTPRSGIDHEAALAYHVRARPVSTNAGVASGLARQIDIYPTLPKSNGQPTPPHVQSESLAVAIDDPAHATVVQDMEQRLKEKVAEINANSLP